MSVISAAKAKGLDAQFALDGVQATYEVSGALLPSTGVTVMITERSGAGGEETVRADYFEIRLRRSEISDPRVGATILVPPLTKYKTVKILYMDNDTAIFQADKIQG